MPVWRCPHCGTPQAETSRCWVCRLSSTTCSTCRHFRRSVALNLGYCGLDRRRAPLGGTEIRGCWEATPRRAHEGGPDRPIGSAPAPGSRSPRPEPDGDLPADPPGMGWSTTGRLRDFVPLGSLLDGGRIRVPSDPPPPPDAIRQPTMPGGPPTIGSDPSAAGPDGPDGQAWVNRVTLFGDEPG